MKKKFAIWCEGYNITGDRKTARCFGVFQADTFKGAVTKWKAGLKPADRFFVDVNSQTFWGCRLYPNEQMARESFG